MEQSKLDSVPKVTPKQLTNTKFRADVKSEKNEESSQDAYDDQNIDDETPKNVDEDCDD